MQKVKAQPRQPASLLSWFGASRSWRGEDFSADSGSWEGQTSAGQGVRGRVDKRGGDQWAESRPQRGHRREFRFDSRHHGKLLKYFKQYLNAHSCLTGNENSNKPDVHPQVTEETNRDTVQKYRSVSKRKQLLTHSRTAESQDQRAEGGQTQKAQTG